MRYIDALSTSSTYQRKEIAYKHRIGLSIIAVQLFAILLVRWLPAFQTSDSPVVFDERQIDTVIELIEPTRHGRPVPAPPRPSSLPPEPVDILLEEDIVFIDFPQPDADGPPEASPEPPGIPVGNPANPATVVRIVEAITPEQVKRENIRLEVSVRFLVSAEGDVDEIDIVRVRKYEPGSTTFSEIDPDEYGITTAIHRAAFQWRFRPARDGGNSVRSYSSHIFTLGV
jgi:hypothetical protein